MKKAKAIIPIVIGSIGILSWFLSLVPGQFPSAQSTSFRIYTDYLMPIISVLMISYGIWLLRRQQEDTSTTPLPDDFTRQIEAGVKLTSKEYINGNIVLLYDMRPQILVFYPIAVLAGLLSPLFTSDYTYLPISLGFCIFYPYIFYRAYVRGFHSSKVFQQELFYTITRETISVKSETLSSQNAWSNIQRVIETKDFFFLFTSATVASIIPKHNLKTEADLVTLRTIIRSYPFPKKLLK